MPSLVSYSQQFIFFVTYEHMNVHNKLECLSLAGILSFVYCNSLSSWAHSLVTKIKVLSYSQQFIFFVYNKQEYLFLGDFFQPGLIIISKAGTYPSEALLMIYKISLGRLARNKHISLFCPSG